MFRWTCCGLLILLAASAAPAQSTDVISELSFLQPGGQVRPNPFGGEPIFVLPRAVQVGAVQPPLPPELGFNQPVPTSNGRPGQFIYTRPGPPKPDINGDPLPAGATARFGTMRLRHGSGVMAMGFTHDGKRLCTVSESEEGIKLWETATGKEVARLRTAVQFVTLAKDGFLVLVNANRIRVWYPDSNLVRELPEKTLPEDASPATLAVNPDSRSVAIATNEKIFLIDIQTGKTLKELGLPGGGSEPRVVLGGGLGLRPGGNNVQMPTKLLYSPDGRWLLGNGRRTGVWLWDLRTGKRVRTYRTEADTVDFSFSTDVTKFIIGGERIHHYPLDSEENVDGFTPPQDLSALHLHPRYSADGKLIYFILGDGSVQPLDAKTGEQKEPLKAPGENFRAPFALAPDASMAAGLDETGGIRIWDPKTGKGPEVKRLPPLFQPGINADGKTVTVFDSTNRGREFDLATGKPGKVFEITDATDGLPLHWDPTGRRVAATVLSGQELDVRFIDLNTGKLIAKHSVDQNGGYPMTSFASGNRDRAAIFTALNVTVVNPGTGKVIRAIAPKNAAGNGHRGEISPDGRLVAVSAYPITVWETATGKKRFTLEDASHDQMTFSDDGRFLVVWDASGNSSLIDLRTGTTARRFERTAGEGIMVSAISRDNKRIATGSPSGRITILDVVSGEPVVTFAGHDGMVSGLVFTANGKKLVSASRDGTALVWDVPEKPYRPAPTETSVASFDEAFRLLANADPTQAQRGLNYLYNNPADTVKQAATRMPAAQGTPATKLKQLVEDLGNDDYQTRETALKELEKLGGEAASLLKDVERSSSNAEARKLAAELLAKLESPVVRADDLKILRLVEAMEHLGTSEARAQLEKWASGPAGHRLTIEAAAAVERLKTHSEK